MSEVRTRRRQAILELVRREPVHTQHELASALVGLGFEATQATVSRDVQELGLVRTPEGYRTGEPSPWIHVRGFEHVPPVAVIRTAPGTANLVAFHVDAAELPGVAGTVAGDDTIIAVLAGASAADSLRRLLSID